MKLTKRMRLTKGTRNNIIYIQRIINYIFIRIEIKTKKKKIIVYGGHKCNDSNYDLNSQYLTIHLAVKLEILKGSKTLSYLNLEFPTILGIVKCQRFFEKGVRKLSRGHF